MSNPSYIKVSSDNLTKIDSYKLLTGCIVPRPVAWISTLSPKGVVNLAPYSAFTIASKVPPKVLFCISKQKPGHTDFEYKDTIVQWSDKKYGFIVEFEGPVSIPYAKCDDEQKEELDRLKVLDITFNHVK